MYLTFHKLKNRAICHHCSFAKKIESKCKIKGNCDFIMYGPGVEKVFESKRTISAKNQYFFKRLYEKKK